MKSTINLAPFLGPQAGITPAFVRKGRARRTVGVVMDGDGSLTVRDGYRSVAPKRRRKAADCDAAKMLRSARSYSGGSPVREYLTVERFGGPSCLLFGCDRTTGRRTLYTLPGSTVCTYTLNLGGATGGTFTVSVHGETTRAIPFSSSPASVQVYLNELSNVEPGDMVVGGSAGNLTIECRGQYLGDQVTVTWDTSLLTGGGPKILTNTILGDTAKVPLLADNFWSGFAWDTYFYLFNPNDSNNPMLRLTIGDYDSVTIVKAPETPGSGFTSRIQVSYERTNGNRYATKNWAGLVAAGGGAEVTYEGTIAKETSSFGSSSAVSSNNSTLSVSHEHNIHGQTWFQVDLTGLTGGAPDLTYVDAFYFEMSSRDTSLFAIHPSITVELTNNDGSPATAELLVTSGETVSEGVIGVYCKFLNKTRSLWDNPKYLKVYYRVVTNGSAAGPRYLDVGPLTLGGIVDWPTPLRLGYTRYTSTFGYESGLGGVALLDPAFLKGATVTVGFAERYLGTWPIVTVTNNPWDPASVTHTRLYVQTPDAKWRRVGEQAVADLTYDYRTGVFDMEGLEPYVKPADLPWSSIQNAVPAHGSVVYLLRGERLCVRWSRVDDPTALAPEGDPNLDFDEDPYGPANFPLADFRQDDPLAAVAVPGGTIILGEQGVYAQIGTVPLSMTAPVRIGSAPGVFGKHAACQYTHPALGPGAAYLSRDGRQVWFARLVGQSGTTFDVQAVEIGGDLADLIFSDLFLSDPDVTPERLHVRYDDRAASLLVCYANRVMALRPTSQVDGVPHWETCRFTNTPSIWNGASPVVWDVDADVGVRALTTEGQLLEFFHDSSSGAASAAYYYGRIRAATAKTPSASSSVTDTVTFATNPGWATGAPVTVALSGGGLLTNTTYYVRQLGTENVYTFYNSHANALAGTGTGLIDLTGAVSQAITPAGRDAGYAVPLDSDHCAWHSGTFDSNHVMRVFGIRCDRDDLATRPKVTVTCERATRIHTLDANTRHRRCRPDLFGREFSFIVVPGSETDVVRDVAIQVHGPGDAGWHK